MRLDATGRDGAPYIDTFDFLCGARTETGDRDPSLSGVFAI